MNSKALDKINDYEIPVNKIYILDALRKKGGGSAGDVYSGRILDTNKQIAIKLEHKKDEIYLGSFFEIKMRRHRSWLKKEYEIYKILDGIERIPKIYWYGTQVRYNCLVMDLLGPSLKDLMSYIGKPFSLGTTLRISIQLLKILKQIHKKGIILRYMKPENMTIGLDENKDNIYLIDFGLAKKYIKNGEHIPYKEKKKVKGNIKFISINTHLGNQLSRRDDIECFGYNLANFMKGKLPWSDLKHSSEIIEKKIKTSLDELCDGLPDEFKEIIQYGKDLKFTQEPDYDYLNKLLIKAAEKNNIIIDDVEYDWDIYKKNKLSGEKIKVIKEENKAKTEDDENSKKNNENERNGAVNNEQISK